MQYRRLGSSGLKVSEIALGGGNFGARVDQAASARVIDYALDRGVNFIDTADWYGAGLSETFIGSALRGRCREVIIATKFGSGVGPGPNHRGASRHHIIEALEKSLKRLQTDYVDLYQLHIPDPETPLEETLRALYDMVRAGKVRYIGASNHAGWQLGEAVRQARTLGLTGFVTAQARYNLLDRRIEADLIPACARHGVGILPWSGLAGGFLTGKYSRGAPLPQGSRMTNPPQINLNTLHQANFDKLAKLEAFAETHGYQIGQLAVAWLLSRPHVSAVLSGPMDAAQLELYFEAITRRLSEAELTELDRITTWQEEDRDVIDLAFLRRETPPAPL